MRDGHFSQEDVERLFGVCISGLRSLGMPGARAAVAAAGIVAGDSARGYWDPFLEAVGRRFVQFSPDAQLSALTVLAGRLSGIETVQKTFADHGFQFIDNTFVPVGILDQREARQLPSSSAADLAKAAKRLAEGDETGAITAACGAVEGLMQNLYAKHGLGDAAHTGFAAKVGTAIKRLGVFNELKSELTAVGLVATDAERIVESTREATMHAAEALQTLRSRMGDVHGSKPALRRLAYDATKWASAICGLFEGHD